MNVEDFSITPCDSPLDLTATRGYTKLELSQSQQIQVGAFLQQIPALTAASELANAYSVRFPAGVSGSLMHCKTGGWLSPIVGEDEKIVAHASFHSLSPQAVMMGCLTVMSIASSQYFLKQINNEMKMMRSKLDDILNFLYGDKKAELMAEVSFVRYAYQNYASIMECPEQRSCVIASLLDARKVAMKDIEFYLSDLDSIIRSKDGKDLEATVESAFQIKDSLIFAMQLYGMSSLLEVHYSQNFNKDYLAFVENDISVYIDKCEKRMLGSFSTLKGIVDGTKGNLFKKINREELIKHIDAFVDSLSHGGESEIQKSLRSALHATTQKADYYMTKEGEVYLKTA